MRVILALIILAISPDVFAQEKAVNTSGELEDIFDEIRKFEQSTSSLDSLYRGRHIKGKISSVDENTFNDHLAQYRKFKNQLEILPAKEMTRQDQISRQIMLLKLKNQIANLEYEMYYIPMNAEGGFYNGMSYILNRLPFETVDNYQDYINWLPDYKNWLEGHVQLMKKGMEKGLVAPEVVISNNLKLLARWNVADPENSPFYYPFLNMPDEIDAAQKEKLREQGTQLIREQILPFYQSFAKFLANDYLATAPDRPGVKFLPNGAEYYENRVRFYTTLNMTPDSVHQLGLKEVTRIKEKMETIIEQVKFDGSFEEFLYFLRTDPQFYAKTPQQLLNHAAWLSKRAEGELPKLFKELYSLPFTVAPVPDDIAPTYTGGRYVPGSWSQQRPGTYWVNTYKLESRPLYTLPALTLHEAVPGHHLQNAIASELKDLPSFRNNYYISAFGEGWGLYSEFLGEEMGIYETPYDLFGRYTYEMWRACRLVIDTGIHYQGWSREQAVDYMQSNTALSLHEVNTEIDRYIGWPGQAVSYKIGELKIKSLRAKAKASLGEKFDVREFHYHVLKNGSVPLTVLEEEIDAYIASTKDSPE